MNHEYESSPKILCSWSINNFLAILLQTNNRYPACKCVMKMLYFFQSSKIYGTICTAISHLFLRWFFSFVSFVSWMFWPFWLSRFLKVTPWISGRINCLAEGSSECMNSSLWLLQSNLTADGVGWWTDEQNHQISAAVLETVTKQDQTRYSYQINGCSVLSILTII